MMNKEEIMKMLKKKQNRYYRQRSKDMAFNDDDYEANYILLYIENLQSKLEIVNNKLKGIKEYLLNYKEPLYIPDDLLKFLESIIGSD